MKAKRIVSFVIVWFFFLVLAGLLAAAVLVPMRAALNQHYVDLVLLVLIAPISFFVERQCVRPYWSMFLDMSSLGWNQPRAPWNVFVRIMF